MSDFVLLESIEDYFSRVVEHSLVHQDHLFTYDINCIKIYNLKTNKRIYYEINGVCHNVYYINGICAIGDFVYVASAFDESVVTVYSKDGYTGNKLPGNVFEYVICSATDGESLYVGHSNGSIIPFNINNGLYSGPFNVSRMEFDVVNSMICYKEFIIISTCDCIQLRNKQFDLINEMKVDYIYNTKMSIIGNLLYIFHVDSCEFVVKNLDSFISGTRREYKKIKLPAAYEGHIIYNNLIYILLGNGIIVRIDGNQIKQEMKTHNYEWRVRINVWNDRIYILHKHGIDIYGEYFPRHSKSLPKSQKFKIKNFHFVSPVANIHKDISLLFTRALLKQ